MTFLTDHSLEPPCCRTAWEPPLIPMLFLQRRKIYTSGNSINSRRASYGRLTELLPAPTSSLTLAILTIPPGEGNQLFFIGGAPQTGNELWVSNGATAGTHLVKDIYQGTSSGLDPSFSQFEPLNNVMYFAATDGLQAHGRELWRSDGTAAGTSMVKDIAPGFDPNTGNANEFTLAISLRSEINSSSSHGRTTQPEISCGIQTGLQPVLQYLEPTSTIL